MKNNENSDINNNSSSNSFYSLRSIECSKVKRVAVDVVVDARAVEENAVTMLMNINKL